MLHSHSFASCIGFRRLRPPTLPRLLSQAQDTASRPTTKRNHKAAHHGCRHHAIAASVGKDLSIQQHCGNSLGGCWGVTYGTPRGRLGNLKRSKHNMKRWEDHMKRSNDYLENIWRTSRGCLETSGAHLEDMLGTSRVHLLHFPHSISSENHFL